MKQESEENGRVTYTVEQLAAVLGLGRGATYAALRRSAIPAIRIGRRFIIPKAAIAEWLRGPERKVETGPSSR